jgi:hypothetical protein
VSQPRFFKNCRAEEEEEEEEEVSLQNSVITYGVRTFSYEGSPSTYSTLYKVLALLILNNNKKVSIPSFCNTMTLSKC